ncbi:DUF3347 domain-containing protein [Pollutibacter soli]|uniref:DUF3347 domain-containing protein n=1 Tax=Pollutibacter soli TaxID=3034157 RepID=UPI0030138F82
MKIKNILFTVFVITLSHFGIAQEQTESHSKLLASYFQLKDALVNSDAKLSATAAKAFIQTLSIENLKGINANLKSKLQKDAQAIAKSGDLEKQRKTFASLSENMVELAKTVKLSPQPVYEQYCPMQKASWLSSEKEIKNPYYGNAMLTCGSVKSTF